MSNIQCIANNDNKNTIVKYKTICDARECNKIATYRVKIFYLKPYCWVCNYHKKDFQKDGLVESIIDKITRGENNLG